MSTNTLALPGFRVRSLSERILVLSPVQLDSSFLLLSRGWPDPGNSISVLLSLKVTSLLSITWKERVSKTGIMVKIARIKRSQALKMNFSDEEQSLPLKNVP